MMGTVIVVNLLTYLSHPSLPNHPSKPRKTRLIKFLFHQNRGGTMDTFQPIQWTFNCNLTVVVRSVVRPADTIQETGKFCSN